MVKENELDKSILYITDSALDPILAAQCRNLLKKVSAGVPIVSVSQTPLNFGTNVCVGNIGRSARSIYTQIVEGLKAVKTRWVMIAEHDCVYSREHVLWIPPDEKYFYYNDNVWLVQLQNPKYPEMNGMFSYRKSRRVQSQLICGTKILMLATKDLLEILAHKDWFNEYPDGRIGEPGTANRAKTLRIASRRTVRHLHSKVKDYIVGYQARDFKTVIPNLDIRHGENFTGQRRGGKRCFSLDPWGTLQEVLGD